MGIIVATAQGLHVFEKKAGDWMETSASLSPKHITSLSAQGSSVLVGTLNGIYRSEDQGKTWWEADDGLKERYIRWLYFHPEQDGLVFAGTEQAAIYLSEDRGQTWQERPEVAALREGAGWYLPYSPASGCVRGFVFDGERGYAAVEVGGVLRSNNMGRTWSLAKGSTGKPYAAIPEAHIHPDVHSIEAVRGSPDRIFAPTGGGLYQSMDGGARWTRMYDCYCRAIWIDPKSPDRLILGPADGVDRNGRVEESRDGGRTWMPAMSGLPDRWPNHMVERFVQVGNELLAVLSNGSMIASAVEKILWWPILRGIQDINAAISLD